MRSCSQKYLSGASKKRGSFRHENGEVPTAAGKERRDGGKIYRKLTKRGKHVTFTGVWNRDSVCRKLKGSAASKTSGRLLPEKKLNRLNSKFDKIMKVLVTGGAGYIGSHTVRQLVKTGADVTVLDNMVYGHAGALVDPEVKLVKGDLGDASVVYPLLMKGDFDAVIHFAAFINVGESVQNPLKYYMNNIARPLVLLGAMQAAGVKRFVFSSTCATYGVPTQIPIPETEKQDPINPYGSSKYMLEKVCRDCDRAWGLKSVFLRYFNASGCSEDGLIGEDHEPETHLIPNILLTLTGEKEYIEVFGTDYDTPDGTCIRDYIHVNDLADAHLKAVDYLMKGGATECFNLGTGLGLSVREILETAEKVTGKKIPVRYGPRREGDPPRLIANPKKAKEILGWEARCKDAGAIVETAWKWMTGPRRGHY